VRSGYFIDRHHLEGMLVHALMGFLHGSNQTIQTYYPILEVDLPIIMSVVLHNCGLKVSML
jgi:hypothetical protein